MNETPVPYCQLTDIQIQLVRNNVPFFLDYAAETQATVMAIITMKVMNKLDGLMRLFPVLKDLQSEKFANTYRSYLASNGHTWVHGVYWRAFDYAIVEYVNKFSDDKAFIQGIDDAVGSNHA